MSEFLWTAAAMAEAMGATMHGPLPEGITGISIDSRTISPGEAYFAITGDVHDGHAFVEAALNNGAGLAVVEAAQCESFPAGARLMVVDDVLEPIVEGIWTILARPGFEVKSWRELNRPDVSLL